MATNLFNKDHKAVSDSYRKGYEQIKWQKPKREEQNDNKTSCDK